MNFNTVLVVGVVSLLFRLPIAILCKVKYLSKSLLTSKNGQEIYKMPHGVLYFILATPDHGMWLKGSMTLHLSLWAGFSKYLPDIINRMIPAFYWFILKQRELRHYTPQFVFFKFTIVKISWNSLCSLPYHKFKKKYCLYTNNRIRKIKNEQLNILCQNLNNQ